MLLELAREVSSHVTFIIIICFLFFVFFRFVLFYFFFNFYLFFFIESDRTGQQVRLPKKRLNSTASRKLGDNSVRGVLMADLGLTWKGPPTCSA